jgi:hypothetical protein
MLAPRASSNAPDRFLLLFLPLYPGWVQAITAMCPINRTPLLRTAKAWPQIKELK